eukprot:m.44332 g.44332  ORF g.44332 m.44332 type:complete len:378 (+) comp5824_c0_seq1:2045-3178(+)
MLRPWRMLMAASCVLRASADAGCTAASAAACLGTLPGLRSLSCAPGASPAMAAPVQATMKAIVVREFGEPAVLKVEEVPTPALQPGQVLVQVMAAGINPVETYVRSGKYAALPALPWTPGNDGAGVVVASNGTDLANGTNVWITGSVTGTYAQYSVCSRASVRALPAGISFEQGAAINIPYKTAYRALFQRAHARAGQTVLVHGASGGVGIATIQFAAAAGLKVLATAGSEAGLALVRQEGAAAAFNHRSEGYTKEIMAATNGKGVDIIVEMLSNVNLGVDLTLLARGGTVAVVGSRGPVEINPRDLMAREASVVGVMAGGADGDEAFAAVDAGLANGTLRPIVAHAYPLAAASDAHRDVIEQASGSRGKLVLQPWA